MTWASWVVHTYVCLSWLVRLTTGWIKSPGNLRPKAVKDWSMESEQDIKIVLEGTWANEGVVTGQ